MSENNTTMLDRLDLKELTAAEEARIAALVKKE